MLSKSDFKPIFSQFDSIRRRFEFIRAALMKRRNRSIYSIFNGDNSLLSFRCCVSSSILLFAFLRNNIFFYLQLFSLWKHAIVSNLIFLKIENISFNIEYLHTYSRLIITILVNCGLYLLSPLRSSCTVCCNYSIVEFQRCQLSMNDLKSY